MNANITYLLPLASKLHITNITTNEVAYLLTCRLPSALEIGIEQELTVQWLFCYVPGFFYSCLIMRKHPSLNVAIATNSKQVPCIP